MHQKIIRLKEVKLRTGLPRSTIYDLIKKKKFPSQIQISQRCVGWLESSIESWISSKIEASQDSR